MSDQLTTSLRLACTATHTLPRSFRLYRSSSSINDPVLTVPTVASYGPDPDDPVVAVMNISYGGSGSDCLASPGGYSKGCVATVGDC